MPAYRFSWDDFDDGTVAVLARAAGHPPGQTEQSARDWLAEKVKRPTPQFVRDHKRALEDTWLRSPGGGAFTQQIVRQLTDLGIGPGLVDGKRPVTPEQCVAYIRRCRNSKNVQRLIAEAMVEFGDQDRAPEDPPESFVPRFVQLTPSAQPADHRVPNPYQEEAWRALSQELGGNGDGGLRSGLLVMPTGSGKTYTAVNWAIREALNNGVRVLWLAHRHSLLEQAGDAVHRLASLAEEPVRVRIVSGHHCSTSQINRADNVIVCSVQSL